MDFMQAVKAGFQNYVKFDGRAVRSEYWWFALFSFVVSVILSVVDGSGILSGVWSLAVFLPSIGLGIRRLHDTDRSGWWLLICLVPLVGILVLLYFLVSKGTEGANRFGPARQMDVEQVFGN